MMLTILASWAEAEAWRRKIDDWVLNTAQRSPTRTTEFLVSLKEQANVKDADLLQTKEEKGRFVFDLLRATADATQPEVVARIEAQGAEYRRFWVANMIWVKGQLPLVEELAQMEEVKRISANPRVKLLLPAAENTDKIAKTPHAVEWNITKIRAPEVWALGYTGTGVVIGGQDTGYDWNHPALVNSYRGYTVSQTNHNYNWHDAIHSGGGSCGSNAVEPCDDQSHGTHTMGTMVGDDGAGNEIGVAPGAKWIGCRNMDQGYGTPATYTECFQWFVAPTDLNGTNANPYMAPDVINNSWSCPSFEGCTNVNMLKDVVESVRAAGIVVVVSAGNEGSACSSVSTLPSVYDASFTVGSTDSGDNIASYSGRGPVTADGSNRQKPDVSAPGSSVRSSVPGTGYGFKSGTSMAAPQVAGTVALILSAHPGLRGQVDRIETLLRRTAVAFTSGENCGDIPGSEIPNNTFGWGRIDALEAVGVGDSDSDNLPNWWEIIFGLNHTNGLDAADDSDGDGFTNEEEFIANTDPTNSLSALRITDIALDATNVVLSWSSHQDGFREEQRYDVYSSQDLTASSETWTRIASNVPPTGSKTCLTNDIAGFSPATTFFRVTVAGSSARVHSDKGIELDGAWRRMR